MIYLKVPWLDGTDADYFSFTTIYRCLNYILAEGIDKGDYIISTQVIDDIPADDYTHVIE